MAEKGEEYISKRERPKEYEKKERAIIKTSDFIANSEKRQLEAEEYAEAIMKPFISGIKKRQFGTEERTNILNALLKKIKDVLIDSFPEIEEKQYDELARIRAQAAIIPEEIYRDYVEDQVKKEKKDLYDARTRIMEDGDLPIEKALALLNAIPKRANHLNKRVDQYKNFK